MSAKDKFIGFLIAIGFFLAFLVIGYGVCDTLINGISNFFGLNFDKFKELILVISFSLSLFIPIMVFRTDYRDLESDIKNKELNAKDNYSQSKFNADFDDKELNNLVKHIKIKVEKLQDSILIKKDIESVLMLEQIENDYLNSIYVTYMDIPPAKRGNKSIKNSPYDLTLRQLNLIIEGLDKIEDKLTSQSVMHQKVNEIFLKQKLANM